MPEGPFGAPRPLISAEQSYIMRYTVSDTTVDYITDEENKTRAEDAIAKRVEDVSNEYDADARLNCAGRKLTIQVRLGTDRITPKDKTYIEKAVDGAIKNTVSSNADRGVSSDEPDWEVRAL